MNNQVILTLIDIKPRKFGTVEEYCLFLSDALAQRGHQSILGFHELPPPWLNERFRQTGAIVEEIYLNGSIFHRLKVLRNIVKKYKVSIIHLTFYPIFSSDPILMKMSGLKKVIFSDQTSRMASERSWIKDKIVKIKNKFISLWIDKIVADAEFIKDDLINKFSTDFKKIKVIYNGVNISRFFPAKEGLKAKITLSIPDDYHVVTTVAYCIPEKGIDVFLNAAKEVLKINRKVKFIVVGDGPLLDNLKDLSSSLGISESVIFLGLKNDVQNILVISDVFVLCSLWEEAFAFSLLEAMACGLPIVASRIGAIPESVIDGETGTLFPPGDFEAAGKAILRILNNPSFSGKLAHAARKRVENNFSMDKWIEQTIDLYESLIIS